MKKAHVFLDMCLDESMGGNCKEGGLGVSGVGGHFLVN